MIAFNGAKIIANNEAIMTCDLYGLAYTNKLRSVVKLLFFLGDLFTDADDIVVIRETIIICFSNDQMIDDIDSNYFPCIYQFFCDLKILFARVDFT